MSSRVRRTIWYVEAVAARVREDRYYARRLAWRWLVALVPAALLLWFLSSGPAGDHQLSAVGRSTPTAETVRTSASGVLWVLGAVVIVSVVLVGLLWLLGRGSGDDEEP